MSKKETTKIEEGVVAEFEGKYWGLQYSDGGCQVYDFGPLELATVANPKYCLQATGMTYAPKNDPPHEAYTKLQKAKLVRIKITTVRTYEIETKP